MNDLERKTVHEFAFEGIDYTGFKIKAAFDDIPWRVKMSALKILNLDTLQWYKNRIIDINNPVKPSDKEIVLYNNFDEYTLPELLKLDCIYQEEEKLRSNNAQSTN